MTSQESPNRFEATTSERFLCLGGGVDGWPASSATGGGFASLGQGNDAERRDSDEVLESGDGEEIGRRSISWASESRGPRSGEGGAPEVWPSPGLEAGGTGEAESGWAGLVLRISARASGSGARCSAATGRPTSEREFSPSCLAIGLLP